MWSYNSSLRYISQLDCVSLSVRYNSSLRYISQLNWVSLTVSDTKWQNSTEQQPNTCLVIMLPLVWCFCLIIVRSFAIITCYTNNIKCIISLICHLTSVGVLCGFTCWQWKTNWVFNLGDNVLDLSPVKHVNKSSAICILGWQFALIQSVF